MKPTTLDQYLALDLKNNHFRYMSSDIKYELISRTPNCTGGLAERAYWLQNKINNYPQCVRCNTILTSQNWYPAITAKQRERGWAQKGYRPFCGKTCAMNSAGKVERTKQTCIDRFGTEFALQSEVVQAKRKLTNLEKYGATNPMAWNSEKFKEAIKTLHGVTAVRHIDGVSIKIKHTKQKQTQELLKIRAAELEKLFEVTLLSELPVDIHRLYDVELRWKHTCGHEYQSNITMRGLRFCPRCSNGTSRAEIAIGDWLEGLGLKVLRRDKSYGFEIDIFLPELNIGIEYDGTYWHSARFVSREKSMQKTKWCEAAQINLITIQEHLWIFNEPLVKARLLSVLGQNTKLMARKCTVQEIQNTEGVIFFNENHLQGGARCAKTYGLFYNEELVAAMSFGKPRFARNLADWELIRFASKIGITVQGGAGKILHHFRINNHGSILSYADRCWSSGNLYKTLGFKFLRHSRPSYFWISGKHIFTRYQTQKNKLEKLLRDIRHEYDPAFSEDDNMRGAKFLKVYDRGNSVWLLD